MSKTVSNYGMKAIDPARRAVEMYDILIVGAGLFGSVVAFEASKLGKKVLVVEKRDHIGGNCYTEKIENINVHKYGAHIFRTSDRSIWEYMQQFCMFNNFINSPIANYKGELYNLPFNMNTFYSLWQVKTPEEAKRMIDSQRVANEDPANLEEHVLNLVGRDIYEKLVKGYTEKQWGKCCRQLPQSIMRRIPLRFVYDNNYFNDLYQGIPMGGYTKIFEQMLSSSEVALGVDFLENRGYYESLAEKIVYTGAIDAYYDYCFGPLEYRSLRFDTQVLDVENYQGVAVMNFTDRETPYTRSIEHKHFERAECLHSVVSWEYPSNWQPGEEPYYPIEDEKNFSTYAQYLDRSRADGKVSFGGRLGEYKYYDMQDTVKSALAFVGSFLRA